MLVSMLTVVGAHPTAMRWRQEIKLPNDATDVPSTGAESDAGTVVLIVDGRAVSTAEVDRMRRSLDDRQLLENLLRYETRLSAKDAGPAPAAPQPMAALLQRFELPSQVLSINPRCIAAGSTAHGRAFSSPRRTRAP